MTRKSILTLAAGMLIGASLGLVLVFGLGLGSGSDLINRIRGWVGGQAASASLSPATKSHASDFVLKDLAGQDVRLSDFRGKTVLVNFWATWCGPCVEEMPLIEKYYQLNQPDLVVLAVNFQEEPADVQAYVSDLGLTFPVLLDTHGRIQDLYRVRGFPTTVFVDGEGIIRYQHIGTLNEKQLSGYLEELGAVE